MVNTTEEITDLVCSTCCYVQQIKSLHKATLGMVFFFFLVRGCKNWMHRLY